MLVLMIAALLLAGCGAKKESATISIAAVSAAETATGMLTESYKIRSGVKFSSEIADSDQALNLLKSGKADIALIDRKLTDEEKAAGFTETAFASQKSGDKKAIYIIALQDITADAAGFRDYILSPEVKDILSSADLAATGA